MIKKINGQYVLFAKSTGRVLGKSFTLKGIKHREQQVNYFKLVKKKS